MPGDDLTKERGWKHTRAVKLGTLLASVGCDEGCGCTRGELARRLKIAADAMKEWRVISCPEDASRVILTALREIEGSE